MGTAEAKRNYAFPRVDKETERLAQGSYLEIPGASWIEIRARIYELNDPMIEPEAWERTMKSMFGSDLFERRPIIITY